MPRGNYALLLFLEVWTLHTIGVSKQQWGTNPVGWVRFLEILIGTDLVLNGLLLIVNVSVAGGIVSAGGIMLPLETTRRFSGSGVVRRGAKGIGRSGFSSLVGIAS